MLLGVDPVTTYVVVADGVATTLAPVVADKPPAGDQVYEDAVPDAVKVVLLPVAIVTSDPAFTVGSGLTVTVVVAVDVPHEAAAAVIV
jgi:hypothetical protein